MNYKGLAEKKNDLITRAEEILKDAETNKRELTDAEAQELAEIRDDVRKIKEALKIHDEIKEEKQEKLRAGGKCTAQPAFRTMSPPSRYKLLWNTRHSIIVSSDPQASCGGRYYSRRKPGESHSSYLTAEHRLSSFFSSVLFTLLHYPLGKYL